MIGDLDDLDQAAVRRRTGYGEPPALQLLAIGVVHFPAVAMALADFGRAVELRGQRAGLDAARPRTEAHGATLLARVRLAFHQVDHGIRAAGAEFGRKRVLDAAHVARELDHRALQSQADAQERNLV